MNWFNQNRWLGRFLVVFAITALLAVVFLFCAKRGFNEAWARFNEAASEKGRLERFNPFPNEANHDKLKGHLENYSIALDQLKQDLKAQIPPLPAFAPNEFQSRLRQAMLATSEKAREAKVKLPDNFALGFEQFTTGLAEKDAAPLLGQQLSQVELLMSILIDARVDGVTVLARTALPPATTSGTMRKPAGAAESKILECSSVDIAFTSTASAARKVLNQIASSERQFYIIRTLHVRNEKDKGPSRAQVEQPEATLSLTASAKPPSNSAINFIVGNEHIETSARIEMVRLTY